MTAARPTPLPMLLAVAAALVAAPGCRMPAAPDDGGTGSGDADGDAVGPCGSGPVTLEVGTGEYEFQALVDGDPVYVVCGPQNGRHVWARFRVRGAPFDATYSATATLTDAATGREYAYVAGGPLRLATVAGACESGRDDPFRVFFSVPNADVAGKTAILKIDVTDAPSGRTVSGQRRVIIDTSMAPCS